MIMKINSKDFRVQPGEEVCLSKRPTMVKPFCKSKKHYQKHLREHVKELTSLQRLHYASNRYALMLVFQGMDSSAINYREDITISLDGFLESTGSFVFGSTRRKRQNGIKPVNSLHVRLFLLISA